MSSFSNSWIREAWIAAPRAERDEGSMAVGRVEGDRIRVFCRKRRWRLVEMRGVCDVPPERMTWVECQPSWRSTFRERQI